MTATFRSELLKLRTTRTMVGFVVSLLALDILLSLVNGFAIGESLMWQRRYQFQLLATGSLAGAFAATIGIMAMTTEFRHGTIRPTLLATPRRRDVVFAKILACSLAGALLGLASVGISFGLGRLVLHLRDIPFALDNRDILLVFAGTTAASALWGAIGTGVGAAVRNQVAGIVGLFVWVMVLESLLFALLPTAGRYFPGPALNVLTQVETPHQLAILPGVLLALVYVVAATAVGTLVTERRDVS